MLRDRMIAIALRRWRRSKVSRKRWLITAYCYGRITAAQVAAWFERDDLRNA